MDFDFKKPAHIFAFSLIIVTLCIIILLPVLTFVGFFPGTQTVDYQYPSEAYKVISEIFVLSFQLFLVIVLMVIFPILWYMLVNKKNVKKAFSQMKISFQNIDKAFLWGLLTAVLIFVAYFIIEIILIGLLNVKPEDISNVQDLNVLFSPFALLLLVATQPVAEEIFFRGFLLDKIESFAGKNMAILLTAVLFGLAHAGYNKIYPIILPMIMGAILAYIVVKTRNLLSAIIAHILFNVTAIVLAFLAGSLT